MRRYLENKTDVSSTLNFLCIPPPFYLLSTFMIEGVFRSKHLFTERTFCGSAAILYLSCSTALQVVSERPIAARLIILCHKYTSTEGYEILEIFYVFSWKKFEQPLLGAF